MLVTILFHCKKRAAANFAATLLFIFFHILFHNLCCLHNNCNTGTLLIILFGTLFWNWICIDWFFHSFFQKFSANNCSILFSKACSKRLNSLIMFCLFFSCFWITITICQPCNQKHS